MSRAARVVLKSFFMPTIFVITGIGLTWAYMRSLDADYALSLFRNPSVEIERVIGSKFWNDEVFDCTYAVVKITEKSAVAISNFDVPKIEAIAKTDARNQHKWPRGWTKTPINDLGPMMCSEPARLCCFDKFDKVDSTEILAGLQAPDGWVSVEGENLAFVLPKQRILGTIRYGD
jgi:hypothetical protein